MVTNARGLDERGSGRDAFQVAVQVVRVVESEVVKVPRGGRHGLWQGNACLVLWLPVTFARREHYAW
jgi:hypothetical protein